jgi:cystathionine beta-lyase family protein involved in aluminum resistance
MIEKANATANKNVDRKIIKEKLGKIAAEADISLRDIFADIDRVAMKRTEDVCRAFARARVSESSFYPTSGYGYGDRGREAIDAVYADVFGCEAAVVRHNIVSGTHALTIGLFGLLRPGDILLSVTGAPYDTLGEVIGTRGDAGGGSLRDFGVDYDEIPLLGDGFGGIDYNSLAAKLSGGVAHRIKVVFAQRSRGYCSRSSLTAAELSALTEFVRARSSAYVVIDNCYGEFTEDKEPTADLIIGSLIKNPGGGLAMSGGYLAGTARAVELASYRLTSPGIGAEVGATLGQNRHILQGFFVAPHTVAQALKTAHFAAYVFDALGFDVSPRWGERRSDIITTVRLGSPEALCAFCRGIQQASPVDGFVTPEPWEMPGYSDKVIMAAGTFVSGASIELSADGPLRPPYTAFLQGALTYESGRLGVLSAAEEVILNAGTLPQNAVH